MPRSETSDSPLETGNSEISAGGKDAITRFQIINGIKPFVIRSSTTGYGKRI